MSPSVVPINLPPAGLDYVSLWAAQPRAVRVFTPQLLLLFDNAPDRLKRYPVFLDGGGEPCAFPMDDATEAEWPVTLVSEGAPSAERLYHSGHMGSTGCIRIRAWRGPAPAEGGWTIVEEMEIVAEDEHRDCIEYLDSEADRLIQQIVEQIEEGASGEPLRLHLRNPHLRHCRDVVNCKSRHCPAYKPAENLRCWEIPETLCPSVRDSAEPLTKMLRCGECEVFQQACPDPLTRLAENFNRLILALQLKYQESLQAHRQLQQADKMSMMGELLAGVAHQIKNPLGIIMGRIELLGLEMEALSPEELTADLGCIQEQVTRMRDLVENLLGMARPLPPAPRPCSINELIRETLPLLKRPLDDAGIAIEVSLSDEVPALRIDPVQVQQVLLNLVFNARDAMPRGGTIVIASEPAVWPSAGAALRVEDEGEGIAPEKLEEVFRPFYSTKLERGGTGLGLAICKRIMKQHRGTIRAERRSPRGTALHLWFPSAEVLS